MITCARCNRELRNPVLLSGVAFGSKCAQAVSGAKAKRKRRTSGQGTATDPRQLDFFA